MRRTLSHIRTAVREGALPVGEALSRRARAAVYLARLVLRILKQWANDRCPLLATALAFQTTLSLVPVLAIAFAMLRASGALAVESQLLEFLSNEVFLDDDIVSHLRGFSEKISTGAAGPGGLAFTFVTCFSLYNSMEKVFNDIWKVPVRRSLMRKLLTFYALVTLLPILAGFYLYWSARLISYGPAARFFGPFAIQVVALLLTNKLLPNTVVRWPAALAGTLVTALLLEAVKWGMLTFAKQIVFASYSGVYGPVALVPMLLGWVYLAWTLILLGVELANAIQNLRLLEAEERRRRDDEPVNGLVAAQLLAAVAADQERGGPGLTLEALSGAFALSPDVVTRMTGRLKAHGLIAEVAGDKQGFIPGRSAGAIKVAEVMAAFRSTDLATADGATSPALAQLIADLDQHQRARLAGLTLADLLPNGAKPPSSDGVPELEPSDFRGK
jgi:membrane protein